MPAAVAPPPIIPASTIATLNPSRAHSAAHAAPTMQLQVSYIRPIKVETGKVFCTGKVIHLGKRSATAEGRIADIDGKLYAHATGTFIVTGLDERSR